MRSVNGECIAKFVSKIQQTETVFSPDKAFEKPREKRATRTRPALWNALLQLLEEQSFEQVTIRDVTARAGISYATFFRHYPDKDALLHDVAAREIRKLLGMIRDLSEPDNVFIAEVVAGGPAADQSAPDQRPRARG